MSLMNNKEKDCQKEKECAKINAANVLQTFYELHVEISREQGQITALQDETEKVTRSNLDRIKDLRYSVKNRQKQLKELAEKAGVEINQLLFS